MRIYTEAKPIEKPKAKRGRKPGKVVESMWSTERKCMERMLIGQCEAFFVEGDNRSKFKNLATQRWIKKSGKVFAVMSGLFVKYPHDSSMLVLVTRES